MSLWSYRAFKIQSKLYVIEYTCTVDGAVIATVTIDVTPGGRSITSADAFKDIETLGIIRTGLGTNLQWRAPFVIYQNIPWFDVAIPAEVFYNGLAELELTLA